MTWHDRIHSDSSATASRSTGSIRRVSRKWRSATSTEPIEYREGDEITTVRKLNGLNKYANITLKWGITDSMDLADWHQLVVDDATPLDDARRNVVIRIQSEAGEDKAAFEVTRAWPCKYDPTDLNGKGNEVAIDTLELCNEGIKRIQ